MGNMEALYNTWKAIGTSGGDLSFFQDFFVKFSKHSSRPTAGCSTSTG